MEKLCEMYLGKILCTASIWHCHRLHFQICLLVVQRYVIIIQGYLTIYMSSIEKPHR